jgi:hypothetical protein
MRLSFIALPICAGALEFSAAQHGASISELLLLGLGCFGAGCILGLLERWIDHS